MLFVIPVLALVRTTVDSEGTAAITENSEKDGTLVRHTNEAAQAETADPWEKWTIKPYWTTENWVTDQGWATIDGEHPLVGIRLSGYGTGLNYGYPPGMKGTPLASQEFEYEFKCDATGEEWSIGWKTSWAKNGDAGDPNGPAYAKDLAGTDSTGKRLHVLHEKQGHQARPHSRLDSHVRTSLFPKEYVAWPSNYNPFKNCPELKFKITQAVLEAGFMGETKQTNFKFGEGVATNVKTQPGSQVLVLQFDQICEKWTGGVAGIMGSAETSPNCFPGQRAAVLLHLNVKDVGDPKNGGASLGSSDRPLEADRVVMYIQES